MPFIPAIAAGIAGVAGGSAGTISAVSGVAGALGSVGQGVAGLLAGAGAGGDQRNLSPAGAFEQQGLGSASRGLSQFEELIGQGPGAEDIQNALGAQRSFADQLGAASEGGLLPTEQDISSTGSLAERLFQGQRFAQEQAFAEQRQGAQRQAALLGRSATDPVLAAKLAQSQTSQSGQLAANQGSFATQLALQQPGQRLSLAGQRANVLGGLASQALNNRQNLFKLGQSVRGQESTFRTNAAGSGPDSAARFSQGLAGFVGQSAGLGGSIQDLFGSFGGSPTRGSAGAGSTVQKGVDRGGETFIDSPELRKRAQEEGI